jgi:hypothetical protein
MECEMRAFGVTATALVCCGDAKEPTVFLDEIGTQFGGDQDFSETIWHAAHHGGTAAT